MATLYNKTALKKIKKDELVQMFLDQQAKLNNCAIGFEGCGNAFESLQAENKKLKDTILSLKSSVDDLREARAKRDHQINKLIEEIEKLKENVMDEYGD